MNKYSKALRHMWRIPYGIFCILFGIAFFGVSIWVSTFSDIASMIFIVSLLGGGFIINYGIGYAFLGDEYKLSNYVRDGNSTFEVIETPKFLKRRLWVTFIASIAYFLLAIYYIVRIIFNIKNSAYYEHIGYNFNNGALIAFVVVSLIIAVVFFLIAAKTKVENFKKK